MLAPCSCYPELTEMDIFRKMFGEEPRQPIPPEELEQAADEASLAVASALMVALERRDDEMGLSAHSARVAILADRIATLLDLDEPLRALLRHTALIHEVGMIGVPAELIRKRGILTPEELAQVHHQAEIGAAIADATVGALAATVIRHQYDDYASLRDRLGDDPAALLLAGILRTADVVDAISQPRPYQPALSPTTRRNLLRAGAGSRFDPLAVDAYLSTAA